MARGTQQQGQLFQRGRPRHLCRSPEQHLGPDRGPQQLRQLGDRQRHPAGQQYPYLPGPLQQRRLVGATHLHPLNSDGSLGNMAWDAATLIPAHTSRSIFTRQNGVGIPFTWAALNATNRALFNLAGDSQGKTGLPICAVIAVASRAMAVCFAVAAICWGHHQLGSRLCRQPGLRLRQRHRSDPGGAGRLSEFPRFYGYSQPYTHALRGANDGMLHGFRVANGVETLAYIPVSLLGI